mgnify:CR=1 FL=1
MSGVALRPALRASARSAFAMFVVLNLGGLLTWVERKQSAIMQDRIGANRASIFGIRALGPPPSAGRRDQDADQGRLHAGPRRPARCS